MSDTPETDQQSIRPETAAIAGAQHVVTAIFAKQLERQRDAYAETIREFLRVSDECAEDRRGFMRILKLADEIDGRHPELAKEASQP